MQPQRTTTGSICPQCSGQPGPKPRGRYCSWACYLLSRRSAPNSTCKECGADFYAFQSRQKAGHGVYCSRACGARAKRFAASTDFWPRVTVAAPDQCWLWCGPMGSYGYGAFKSAGVTVGAHRLAWILANGSDVPSGMVVRHKCHVRLCCNPAHLELGTVQDNNTDKMQARRQAKGERCHTAKLHADTIPIIRARERAGESLRSLAAEYGVYPSTISAAVKRRTWGHIP